MAFPEEVIPVKVEISLDAGWTDITEYVYKQPIEIERGAADEATYTSPTKCTFLINNIDGRFSPRNPNSPYFGQLKKNTPILVSYEGGPCFLDVPENGGAQVANFPQLTGDIDIAVEFQSHNWGELADLTTAITREVFGHMEFGGGGWLLRIAAGRPAFYFSEDWSTFNSYSSPDYPSIPPNGIIALRVTVDVSTGEIEFFWAPTLNDEWLSLGTQSHGGAISFDPYSAGLRLGDALLGGGWDTLYGKVFRAQVRDGIHGPLVADIDFTEQTDGDTSFEDNVGNTWTTVGQSHVNNQWNRFRGQVPAWPSRWTTGGLDAWVEVRAETYVRRLLQGSRGLESALARRVITDPDLVAYWPMEEPDGATSFYSPVPGIGPMTFTGDVTVASHVGPPGSKDLPQLNEGARYKATTTQGGTSGWQVEFVVDFQQFTPTDRVVATIWSTGSAKQWRIAVNNTGYRILCFDRDDTEILDTSLAGDPSFWLNNWARVRLSAVQDGSDVDWRITRIAIGESAGSFTGSISNQSVGRAYAVTTHEDGINTDIAGFGMGHLAIFSISSLSDESKIFNDADYGFAGDTAYRRLVRLVDFEQGDNVLITGQLGDFGTRRDITMGAQRPDRYVDLVREAATAERGIMTDNRDDARIEGFKFIRRSSLENQEPVLVLDYEGDDGLVTPMDPTDDDLYIRNDITVERERGSSYRMTLETGPNSIEEVGQYEGGQPVNVETDDQLPDIAGWELHLGTWDEERYPTLTLYLHNAPHKIGDWLRLEQGSIVKILNARSEDREWIPPGDLMLMVRGYVERMHNFTWVVELQCVPARPWDVTVLDSLQNRAEHLGAEEIYLAIAADEDDTAIGTQAYEEAPTWTDDLEDYPFVVMMGGEAVVFEAPGNTVTPNGLMLTDAAGFTAVNGAIAYTTDVVHPDPVSTGTVLVTPNGSSATGGILSAQATAEVRVGRSFRAGCWVFAPNGLADFRALISWYNSGGTLISTETGSATTVPAGRWTWVSGTYSAPANAARCAARGQHASTPSADDAYYVWGLRASPATANLVEDSFTRSVTDSWGSADTGHVWQQAGGVTADYDVVSTYGRHVHSATSVTRASLIPGNTDRADIVASLTTAALSTGSSQFCGVIQRFADADNLYEARVAFDSSNGITLTLRRRLAGSETVLGTWNTDWTHSAGAYVWVRFWAHGDSLKAKIWQDGKTEPDAWQIRATDSSHATGQVGIKTVRNAGNTNTNADLRCGHFSFQDAQAINVVRSWNYVVKSHSTLEPLEVLHEATLAI